MKDESHSSTARPAPKPVPNHKGHARRLKIRTEKMTPNESPRPDLMMRLDKQRSHLSFNKASLKGLDVLEIGACVGVVVVELVSAMVKVECTQASSLD